MTKNTLIVKVVVLAAGMGSRMAGCGNKLLAKSDGQPLVRQVCKNAINVGLPVVVVVGFQKEEIQAALVGLSVTLVENHRYKQGMGTSLSVGFASKHLSDADGILVMLADMPHITTLNINQMVSSFQAAGGDIVVRASSAGKSGNPVLIPRSLHEGVRQLSGDIGAKNLIRSSGVKVVEVEVGEGVHIDLDTAEELSAWLSSDGRR